MFFGFLGIRSVWGKRSHIPLNHVQSHRESNPKSPAPYFISDETLLPFLGQIIPVSQLLRYWGNLGKLGLNTPNHVKGHMKSNVI